MPVIPNTNQRGRVFISAGDGTNRGAWGGSNANTDRLSATYAVLGPQSAGTLPGFFVPVPDGQTVVLIGVAAVISAGSVTVDISQNGLGVSGLAGIGVTTSPTGYVLATPPDPVADLDFFAVDLSSIVGGGDLSVSFIFDLTP